MSVLSSLAWQKENGVLRDGAALLQLLNNGVRGGEARYFTFVVMGDSMRFSETGAQFLADMLSKHAMHANCSEKVCTLPFSWGGRGRRRPAEWSMRPGIAAVLLLHALVKHTDGLLCSMLFIPGHFWPLPQVLFAGEFCILPSLTQPAGSYRFIVDNNSGTFAPPPCCLPAMGELFRFNFPGLEVEVGLPLVWN